MATKRKDGRLQQKVTVNGKQYFFYGKTQAEINRKILNFHEEIANGRLFREVADEWYGEAMENISPSTVRGYKRGYELAREYFGDKRMREIDTRDVNNYLVRIAEKHDLSIKSVKNYKIVLSVIFRHGIAYDDCDDNPVTNAVLPKNAKPKEKRPAAGRTDEQIIAANPSYDFPAPYIALYTGMRKGEILGLQRGDIDFTRRIIHVRRSVWQDGANVGIKTPKTEAGTRDIPIFSPLTEFLAKYKSLPKTAYIMPGHSGEPMNLIEYRAAYKRYCEETGMQCTLHQIRHSYTSIAVAAGVPVPTLQEILGHANYQTTMDIYNEFRSDSLDNARDILKSGFSPK